MADLTPAEQAEYDQLLAKVAELQASYERRAIADAEQALAISATSGMPWPNTCHPAYAGNVTVSDWVNRRGYYADLHTLRLPITHRVTYHLAATTPELYEDLAPTRSLARRRCYGFAPYVGRPFVYMWDVATDELGRHVAGDTRIVYRDGRP